MSPDNSWRHIELANVTALRQLLQCESAPNLCLYQNASLLVTISPLNHIICFIFIRDSQSLCLNPLYLARVNRMEQCRSEHSSRSRAGECRHPHLPGVECATFAEELRNKKARSMRISVGAENYKHHARLFIKSSQGRKELHPPTCPTDLAICERRETTGIGNCLLEDRMR